MTSPLPDHQDVSSGWANQNLSGYSDVSEGAINTSIRSPGSSKSNSFSNTSNSASKRTSFSEPASEACAEDGGVGRGSGGDGGGGERGGGGVGGGGGSGDGGGRGRQGIVSKAGRPGVATILENDRGTE